MRARLIQYNNNAASYFQSMFVEERRPHSNNIDISTLYQVYQTL